MDTGVIVAVAQHDVAATRVAAARDSHAPVLTADAAGDFGRAAAAPRLGVLPHRDEELARRGVQLGENALDLLQVRRCRAHYELTLEAAHAALAREHRLNDGDDLWHRAISERDYLEHCLLRLGTRADKQDQHQSSQTPPCCSKQLVYNDNSAHAQS